jgi:hypothetical protein
MRTALAVALALVASRVPAADPAGATTSAAAGGEVAALLADADAAYARRDEAGQAAVVGTKLAQAEKAAPGDYGVLWRIARINVWIADDPKIDGKERTRIGKIAWDYGDRATAAEPARVEGWYWAAAGAGLYGLGLGVLTALKMGLEGKFKERLGKAEAIDPGYNHGAIQTAWGRFYYELPWPKYDPRKSEAFYREALKQNPFNVRAHVYLGQLFAKEDRGPEAQAQFQAALAKPPGQYDAPEERRWQAEAKRLLAGR